MAEDASHQHGSRGVTRPMAMRQQHGGDSSDHDRRDMLRMHHRHTLWIYWLLVILGVWMILAPLTFSYAKDVVQPSGGRTLWLSDTARIWMMTTSDIVAGVLLLVFGWRSLTPNRPVSLWICCFVGIWLTFAPVIFWAPTAAGYLNSTLVGILVIGLTILIPGMPNMILFMKHGPPQPPGWSYNPSSWPQRSVLIALAVGGWLVSRYLGAFQMGYIEHAWDPFFGNGTRRVLNSDLSHMWPVSDAAFGAIAYTFEFAMAWMGAPSRWRTMPWMVLLFGILVIPLGLVHILLVISQPVVVGAWCTFCLLAALFMLPMIPLEVDEVVAMGQHLVRAKRRGESLWHVFWKGGDPEGSQEDERTPEMAGFPQQPLDVPRASLWGMSFPWTLTLATALGVWIMLGPAMFGVARPAANVHFVAGALVITVSVCAMGEPIRLLRYLNVLIALALAVVPWLMSGETLASRINALIAGLIVAGLSIPRGPQREHYGTWDKLVR
ncbi:MAG: vitamin K epoxide reductase family protein [Phycisphaeraceae bacterium]